MFKLSRFMTENSSQRLFHHANKGSLETNFTMCIFLIFVTLWG